MARSVAGRRSFVDGWTRLTLVACPGAAASPSATLVVEDVRGALGFKPGRPGAVTLGVLDATGPRGGDGSGRRTFAVTGLAPASRTVVLAPWPGDVHDPGPDPGRDPGAAPSVGVVRLRAR